MIENFAPQHFTAQAYPMWAVTHERIDGQPSEVCLGQIVGWVPWCTDTDGHIEQMSPVLVALPGGSYPASDFVPSTTADAERGGHSRLVDIYVDLDQARSRAAELATP